MPQKGTRKVAKRNDAAKGANIMAPEYMKCPTNHAVSRSGRYSVIFVTNPTMLLGGLEVNPSSSGERIKKGRRNAPENVTIENTTSAMLPMRPTSPSASLDPLTLCGTSYLKYVSPTHVLQ
jgi:hypothetical protein